MPSIILLIESFIFSKTNSSLAHSQGTGPRSIAQFKTNFFIGRHSNFVSTIITIQISSNKEKQLLFLQKMQLVGENVEAFQFDFSRCKDGHSR